MRGVCFLQWLRGHVVSYPAFAAQCWRAHACTRAVAALCPSVSPAALSCNLLRRAALCLQSGAAYRTSSDIDGVAKEIARLRVGGMNYR